MTTRHCDICAKEIDRFQIITLDIKSLDSRDRINLTQGDICRTCAEAIVKTINELKSNR